jgi:hypothetical protein
MSLIGARDEWKTYTTAEVEVRAVQGVSFDIDAGAFVGPLAAARPPCST